MAETVFQRLLRSIRNIFHRKKNLGEQKQPARPVETGQPDQAAAEHAAVQHHVQAEKSEKKSKPAAPRHRGKRLKKRPGAGKKIGKKKGAGVRRARRKAKPSIEKKARSFLRQASALKKKQLLLQKAGEEYTRQAGGGLSESAVSRKIDFLDKKVIGLETTIKKQDTRITKKVLALIKKTREEINSLRGISSAAAEKAEAPQVTPTHAPVEAGARTEIEKDLLGASVIVKEEIEKANNLAKHAVIELKTDFLRKKISKPAYKRILNNYKKNAQKLTKAKEKLEKIIAKRKAENKIVGSPEGERFQDIEGIIKKYSSYTGKLSGEDKVTMKTILYDFHRLIGVIDAFKEITQSLKGITYQSSAWQPQQQAPAAKPGGFGGYAAPAQPAQPSMVVQMQMQKPFSEIVKSFETPTAVKKKTEKLVTVLKEIKKFHIETDFDRLFRLVQEKKTVTSRQAYAEFGISSRDFEEFGEVLEKEGLVKMSYPPLGSAKIMLIKQASNNNSHSENKNPVEKRENVKNNSKKPEKKTGGKHGRK